MMKERFGKARRYMATLLVLGGLTLLIAGAELLVRGASRLAKAVGLPSLLIGLTIVAAGTSMPELATSVVASIRGERDIAVGNVVGSNIFNILAVLGASAVVAPAGVAIAPSALRFDIPVMTATAVVCLPVFFTGGRISRAEGLLFLLYYVAYIVFLVLHATSEPQAALFGTAILWFAGPLTLVGLVLSVLYAVRRHQLHS
jgi:cation:H+ antiporter